MHTLAAHGLYVHSLPGRLRLELPALSANPALTSSLQAQLAAAHGVKSVSASSLTARLLVTYDPHKLTLQQLMGLIHAKAALPCCGAASVNVANGLLGMAVEHVLSLGVQVALGL